MTSALRARSLRWGLRIVVLAILGGLLIRLGAAPFVAGLQRLTGLAVLTAAAITAATTVVSAWRWTLVSRALASPLSLRAAVTSYYRSQLLNSVLPGGITGDLERGLRSGGPVAARLHGIRVVAWDRASGQLVQLALLAAVLPALDATLLPAAAALAGTATMLIGGVVFVGRHASRRGSRRLEHVVAGLGRDLRLLTRRPATALALLGASVLVALLHASVFVLAAVITGAPFDPVRLLPLAIAVQASMAVPVGFGGLGPREGMAVIVFSGAGLGAAHGAAAAVAYGALALIAVLPGLIPLARTGRGRRAPVAALAPAEDGVPR